jgi:hypothetical protein
METTLFSFNMKRFILGAEERETARERERERERKRKKKKKKEYAYSRELSFFPLTVLQYCPHSGKVFFPLLNPLWKCPHKHT